MTISLRLWVLSLAIAAAMSGGASAQSNDGTTGFDFCPELKRTVDNPDGERDCGPGCIEEENFYFKRGLAAVDELKEHVFEAPSGDAWETKIGLSTELAVAKGALLRLRMLVAYQQVAADKNNAKAKSEYEQYRSMYCEFLRDDARYLD